MKRIPTSAAADARRRTRFVSAVIGWLLALALSNAAAAATHSLSCWLNGAQIVPSNGSSAAGSATIVLNDVTGAIAKRTSWYYELQSVIEDAVECGAQGATQDFRAVPLNNECNFHKSTFCHEVTKTPRFTKCMIRP